MADEPPNLLPTYYALLREAFTTSEAVDNFDLHSEDHESVKRWKELVMASGYAQGLLVQYASDHHFNLSLQLGMSVAETISGK